MRQSTRIADAAAVTAPSPPPTPSPSPMASRGRRPRSASINGDANDTGNGSDQSSMRPADKVGGELELEGLCVHVPPPGVSARRDGEDGGSVTPVAPPAVRRSAREPTPLDRFDAIDFPSSAARPRPFPTSSASAVRSRCVRARAAGRAVRPRHDGWPLRRPARRAPRVPPRVLSTSPADLLLRAWPTHPPPSEPPHLRHAPRSPGSGPTGQPRLRFTSKLRPPDGASPARRALEVRTHTHARPAASHSARISRPSFRPAAARHMPARRRTAIPSSHTGTRLVPISCPHAQPHTPPPPTSATARRPDGAPRAQVSPSSIPVRDAHAVVLFADFASDPRETASEAASAVPPVPRPRPLPAAAIDPAYRGWLPGWIDTAQGAALAPAPSHGLRTPPPTVGRVRLAGGAAPTPSEDLRVAGIRLAASTHRRSASAGGAAATVAPPANPAAERPAYRAQGKPRFAGSGTYRFGPAGAALTLTESGPETTKRMLERSEGGGAGDLTSLLTAQPRAGDLEQPPVADGGASDGAHLLRARLSHALGQHSVRRLFDFPAAPSPERPALLPANPAAAPAPPPPRSERPESTESAQPGCTEPPVAASGHGACRSRASQRGPASAILGVVAAPQSAVTLPPSAVSLVATGMAPPAPLDLEPDPEPVVALLSPEFLNGDWGSTPPPPPLLALPTTAAPARVEAARVEGSEGAPVPPGALPSEGVSEPTPAADDGARPRGSPAAYPRVKLRLRYPLEQPRTSSVRRLERMRAFGWSVSTRKRKSGADENVYTHPIHGKTTSSVSTTRPNSPTQVPHRLIDQRRTLEPQLTPHIHYHSTCRTRI